MSHPPHPTPVRQFLGFSAGLLLVVLCGWALLLGAWWPAHRYDMPVPVLVGLAAAVSLGLFVVLERDFWLSRLMGLRVPPRGTPVKSAVLFWLFGLAWLFVKTAIIDPDRPEEAEGGTTGEKGKTPAGPRDPVREAVETIVFVVVLVLLLKLFVTEAFVIPTGSMATTLLGYHQTIACEQCGFEFPVNSHDEVEPSNQDGKFHKLVKYCCPNCRFRGAVDALKPRPKNESGDRVLVLKPAFHVGAVQRGDVVVFKFPEKPQEKFTAQNYIKRAMAFGGETAGIYRGDLYVTTALEYPEAAVGEVPDPENPAQVHLVPLYPRPADPKDLWRGDPSKGPDYRYTNNPQARAWFEASRRAGLTGQAVKLDASGQVVLGPDRKPVLVPGGFEVVRKNDEHMLACRRIVWDNDQQPGALAGRVPSRWYDAAGSSGGEAWPRWKTENPNQPRKFSHSAGDLDWLRYRHLVWAEAKPDQQPRVFVTMPNGRRLRHWDWTGELAPPVPGPIDNFLGYNAGSDASDNFEIPRMTAGEDRWVGDLTLECEATLQDGGEVTLELSKGTCRFRATFAGGQVRLTRVTRPNPKAPEVVEEIASQPSRMSGRGTYRLRFANVDCRLRVWVNDRAIAFGPAADYAPGSTLPPPGISDQSDSEGWTVENDVDAPASIGAKGAVSVEHLKLYRDIYYTGGSNSQADVYYVHPGHYFCLGDNSSSSADSRTWGLVPERLMLGKAVFVFFPLDRLGFIK